MSETAILSTSRIDAAIFDLDGVITRTATLHARAWKAVFDEYLERRRREPGEVQAPFDIDVDYRQYVDGKPRHDGVASFLASRGVALPRGAPGDPPTAETICGLGNAKNERLLALLDQEGPQVYDSSVALVQALRRAGVKTAVVSSSRNCERILRAAGAWDLFDAEVDGRDLADRGLKGKPAPDLFLEAARRLEVPAARAAVFEDAVAGVEAGRAGAFGLVVGVDRHGHGDGLLRHGADVVVADLSAVSIERPGLDGAAPEAGA